MVAFNHEFATKAQRHEGITKDCLVYLNNLVPCGNFYIGDFKCSEGCLKLPFHAKDRQRKNAQRPRK
jgi:hypothetical protein